MWMKSNQSTKNHLTENSLFKDLSAEVSSLKPNAPSTDSSDEAIIPKLKFSPDSGFSMSADMLAKLNLLPKPAETVDISTTSEYTKDEKNALVKSFTIKEEGMFLGIIIGVTSKAEVIEIMDEYTTVKLDTHQVGSALFYNDISVNFYFDNSDIVDELEFGNSFRGNTAKGLRIGDTIEKAIEIYGPPRMKTSIGAIWDKMKIFSDNFSITGIKIRR